MVSRWRGVVLESKILFQSTEPYALELVFNFRTNRKRSLPTFKRKMFDFSHASTLNDTIFFCA